MTLNKHAAVRAALCWIPEIAGLARQHNDANVLVMPGRFIDTTEATAISIRSFPLRLKVVVTANVWRRFLAKQIRNGVQYSRNST